LNRNWCANIGSSLDSNKRTRRRSTLSANSITIPAVEGTRSIVAAINRFAYLIDPAGFGTREIHAQCVKITPSAGGGAT
jgi:hypothetical protein